MISINRQFCCFWLNFGIENCFLNYFIKKSVEKEEQQLPFDQLGMVCFCFLPESQIGEYAFAPLNQLLRTPIQTIIFIRKVKLSILLCDLGMSRKSRAGNY